MDTKKYLNQLIKQDSDRHVVVTGLLKKIVQLLEVHGEKAKKPTAEVMNIHSTIFSNKNVTSGLNELYSACVSIFEKYIREHMLSQYKDALSGEEMALQFVSDWNAIHKLCTWVQRPFIELPKLDKYPVPLYEQPYLLFNTHIYSNAKIKQAVNEYLLSKLTEKSDQENGTGKGLPPHRAIIKAFALLNYSLEDFDVKLSQLMKDQFEEELKSAQDRKQKRNEDQSSRSMYDRSLRSVQSTTDSFSHRPLAPTNFNPYKSETGHVGLRNQGATCYLNSLIQSLFMTPAFRRAVFNWRYDKDKDLPEELCIPLQLQKLFAQLLLSEHKSVETKELTRSFGWDRKESFTQHDVQELLKVLFDALSTTTIPIHDLYEGFFQDYVICQNCNYVGGRKEIFADIALAIRNVRHLHEAIENFQYEEKLNGENQYHCDRCARRVDALKGTKLLELPDVLTFHLKRFDIDFFTMSRVKLNNEVIFPQVLDMNRHLKSSNVVKVSDIDSKHNIYDLYAILMHSGGAHGGHYFAYIKDGDNWYEYNDSSVSRIDEKEIQEKAYGGSHGYGANAYMLMYVRQFPISEAHNQYLTMDRASEIELIPLEIRQQVDKMNEEYTKGQREYELKREKANLTVFIGRKKVDIAIEHSKTVAELLQHLHITCKLTGDIAQLRLRMFNVHKKIPGEILDSGTVLRDIDFSRSRMTLILEDRSEGNMLLDNHDPASSFIVRLSAFDSRTNTFSSERYISTPTDVTLSQFSDYISSALSIQSDKLLFVFQRFTNATKNTIVMSDPYLQLRKDYGVNEGDIIYMEENEDSNELLFNSAIAKYFDTRDHIIDVKFETVGPDLPKTIDQCVKIDRRKTIADLKHEIAMKIGVIEDGFKLSFGREETSYSLNDLDERLNQFPNNIRLFVRKGEQLSSKQYNVTFYMMQDSAEIEEKRRVKEEADRRREAENAKRFPGVGRSMNGSHSDYNYPRRVKWEDDEDDSPLYSYTGRFSSRETQWTKLFDTVLNKSETVKDIKQMLIDLAKKQVNFTAPPSAEYLRLREKIHGRAHPGRILLDHEEPFQALASATVSAVPNREIIVERISRPEALSTNHMIIRLARWKPSLWTIRRAKEIIVERSYTVADLIQRIVVEEEGSELLHTDQISLKRIPYQLMAQLRDNQFMSNMNWNDSKLKMDSVITNEPWFLQDADMVLFKDNTETDWFTLHEKSHLLSGVSRQQQGNATSVGGGGGASHRNSATGEPTQGTSGTSTTMNGHSSREKALKFYSQQQNTTNQQYQQFAATPEDNAELATNTTAGGSHNIADHMTIDG